MSIINFTILRELNVLILFLNVITVFFFVLEIISVPDLYSIGIENVVLDVDRLCVVCFYVIHKCFNWGLLWMLWFETINDWRIFARWKIDENFSDSHVSNCKVCLSWISLILVLRVRYLCLEFCVSQINWKLHPLAIRKINIAAYADFAHIL